MDMRMRFSAIRRERSYSTKCSLAHTYRDGSWTLENDITVVLSPLFLLMSSAPTISSGASVPPRAVIHKGLCNFEECHIALGRCSRRSRFCPAGEPERERAAYPRRKETFPTVFPAFAVISLDQWSSTKGPRPLGGLRTYCRGVIQLKEK